MFHALALILLYAPNCSRPFLELESLCGVQAVSQAFCGFTCVSQHKPIETKELPPSYMQSGHWRKFIRFPQLTLVVQIVREEVLPELFAPGVDVVVVVVFGHGKSSKKQH